MSSKRDAPRYRKLYPMFWRDSRVRTLSLEEKLVAAYCLTCHQANRIGLFSFSIAAASEELDIPIGTFSKRFANVCGTLGWAYDEGARCLYIPTWWKWNHPEGPNIMIGNLRDVSEVPESMLMHEFAANIAYLRDNVSETFTQTMLKRLGNLPQTFPERSGIQEQEQEQESKSRKARGSDQTEPSGNVPRFVKPTIQEVSDYCRERGNSVDAQKFIDHYTSNGWRVGKTPMKDWQASVRTWERSEAPKPVGSRPSLPDLTDDDLK